MKKRLDLSGQTYGRLKVSSAVDCGWLCHCDCGGRKIASTKQLRSGKTASCGCALSDMLRLRNSTHGMSSDPAYRSWKDMRSRCNTPTDSDYKDYGGRGISVCARWDDFAVFLGDMGPRPVGMSVDRKDVNGNYEPNNCRWADAKTQANNKRSNHVIEFCGRRQTLAAWCSETGVDTSKARYRLRMKWPIDKVFSVEDFRRS